MYTHQEQRTTYNSFHWKQPESVPQPVERYLIGTPFPVNKRDLLSYAEGNDAPKEVMTVLQRFGDKEYGSVLDVSLLFNHLQKTV